MPIHPTAIVHPSAEIDPTAEIGAYCVIEAHTRIGPAVRLYPHAYISEYATIGRGCQIHPFAVVGHLPQDVAFKGEPSYTEIGEETIIREHACIHRGTTPGSTTKVGRGCFIMATSHVAHNCVVGDRVILIHGAMLGGYAAIGERAIIGGNAGVHQFVRIGELAMIAGYTRTTTDVPPFVMTTPAGIGGLNTLGLRRAGFSSAERLELRECHRLLYRSGLHFPQALERIAQMVATAPGRRLVEFLAAPTKRGYMRRVRRDRDRDGEPPPCES
jgi:UDP-N-acetylglucosamine acyltransferase